MSIIIKGVDLPEKGETLILKIKGSRIYQEYPRYKFQPTRIKDAEAIQIPNPHGDLIDRKQVFTYSHRDVKNLEEVPVILEGEEW